MQIMTTKYMDWEIELKVTTSLSRKMNHFSNCELKQHYLVHLFSYRPLIIYLIILT